MPYEKLKTELLAAREQREQYRQNIARELPQTLLQIGLNQPGADKSSAKGTALIRWALQRLHPLLPASELLAQGEDLLGSWALLTTPLSAVEAKRRAVTVESAQLAARLLDIDVYRPQGSVIGRKELRLAARKCFLCFQPAVDCMRLQSHSFEQLKVRVDELFVSFRP